MRAILFPGQGSQYVGMGLDFYEKFDLAKKIFETVDKSLGFSLSKIIFNGPQEQLQLTQNTQPAIMTVGVSIFNVLNQEYGLKLNNASFFAGHSLGEYSALVANESLSFKDSIKLFTFFFVLPKAFTLEIFFIFDVSLPSRTKPIIPIPL